MAHVEIGTYFFRVTLWVTHATLLDVVQSHVLPFENLVMQFYPQM